VLAILKIQSRVCALFVTVQLEYDQNILEKE